ncbi:hypothetical protein KR222_009433, partial [Zaprionus bogoriensis]
MEPMILGCFSLTSEHLYVSGTAEMKYFVLPRDYPIYLNKYIEHDEEEPENEYLDHVLYYIREHQQQLLTSSPFGGFIVQAEVVTHSEVLQTLLCTVYIRRNWRILGTRYRNTLYLCLDRSAASVMPVGELLEKRKIKNMLNALKQILHSGTWETWSECISKGQLYGVFRWQVGGLTVVYDAPMGAHHGLLRKPGKEKLEWFAECKILLPQESSAQSHIEPSLALRWCTECSLKGVEKMFLARPWHSGLVNTMQKCSISSLIRAYVSNNWCFDTSTNFLLYTLQHFGNIMKIEDPSSVYQFDYNAATSALSYSVCGQRNEKSFIADWYRDVLERP